MLSDLNESSIEYKNNRILIFTIQTQIS